MAACAEPAPSRREPAPTAPAPRGRRRRPFRGCSAPTPASPGFSHPPCRRPLPRSAAPKVRRRSALTAISRGPARSRSGPGYVRLAAESPRSSERSGERLPAGGVRPNGRGEPTGASGAERRTPCAAVRVQCEGGHGAIRLEVGPLGGPASGFLSGTVASAPRFVPGRAPGAARARAAATEGVGRLADLSTASTSPRRGEAVLW